MDDKIEQVLRRFKETTSSSVSLCAILKMDDLINTWSIFLAADWINENNKRETFDKFLAILLDVTTPEEIKTIARLGIFNTSEYLAKLLIARYHSGDIIDSDEQVNGNIIHEGFIIEVNR